MWCSSWFLGWCCKLFTGFLLMHLSAQAQSSTTYKIAKATKRVSLNPIGLVGEIRLLQHTDVVAFTVQPELRDGACFSTQMSLRSWSNLSYEMAHWRLSNLCLTDFFEQAWLKKYGLTPEKIHGHIFTYIILNFENKNVMQLKNKNPWIKFFVTYAIPESGNIQPKSSKHMSKQLWKAVNPGTKYKDKPIMKHLLYKHHTASR
ncbi:hypothetical protein OUZ56_020630 [Daphnia magna]|uniref:Uncharacterized protein n=1 Tax=Daphnia magna TaxID=35525 RepID=A0ABQ9ZFR0_9CRUS|nr:hypothetical protein OUZ56_020630 [Daphnia magna]